MSSYLVSNDVKFFYFQRKNVRFLPSPHPKLNHSEKHNFGKHFDFNASWTSRSKFCFRKKIKICWQSCNNMSQWELARFVQELDGKKQRHPVFSPSTAGSFFTPMPKRGEDALQRGGTPYIWKSLPLVYRKTPLVHKHGARLSGDPCQEFYYILEIGILCSWSFHEKHYSGSF